MGGGGFPPGSHACLCVACCFPPFPSPARFPLFPLSLRVSLFLCLLLGPGSPSRPPPASSEPSVSFLFLFVWRTKAGRAAKGNEFKEAAIVDFLRTGECAHGRCVRVRTLTRTHTRTHPRQERGWLIP